MKTPDVPRSEAKRGFGLTTLLVPRSVSGMDESEAGRTGPTGLRRYARNVSRIHFLASKTFPYPELLPDMHTQEEQERKCETRRDHLQICPYGSNPVTQCASSQAVALPGSWNWFAASGAG